jgi:hypothetical protein
MEDQEQLRLLAETLRHTRAELDALRIVFIATLAHLSAGPQEQTAALAQELREAIEQELAFSLGTPMSDQMVQARHEWMLRLLPPTLLTLVQKR